MSENWGDCRRCRGMGVIKDPVLFREAECGSCLGTGMDGSVEAWLEREEEKDRASREMEDFSWND